MDPLSNGQAVDAADIVRAVTTAPLLYGDGARQVFEASGATTYTEGSSATHGTWSVEDGRFCSFWPPSYRACYELFWVVEQGSVTGLQFTELGRGTVFTGRYR
jgi:hypothetical protein